MATRRMTDMRTGGLVLSGAACLLWGCARSGGDEPRTSTLSIADFVRTAEAPVESPATPGDSPKSAATASLQTEKPEPPPVIARGSKPDSVVTRSAGVVALTGSEGDTASSGVGSGPVLRDTARASGGAVVLESHVGQVNGKPIFASEILEPLDGRLRALGREARTKDQWQRQAGKSIYDELIRRVRDELVLAEARANLTPEQRQGLVFFLGEIQKNLVAGSRGSEVLADETLRESTSRSLAKESQDRLDRELIANELRTRVMPRVAVPWRDVQLEYERNIDKYNPPPVAHFRMIVLDTQNVAGVAQVTSSLSGGLSFSEVASQRPNEFNRAKGGEFDREFSENFAEAKFSEIAEVNAVMQRLSPGQTQGPITYRDKTAWVHLENIETRPSKSLYEAQYEIEQELREERFRIEEQRYFDNLLKRGNVTKFENMMTRLVEIAQERYMPASLLNAPTRGTSPVRPQR